MIYHDGCQLGHAVARMNTRLKGKVSVVYICFSQCTNQSLKR